MTVRILIKRLRTDVGQKMLLQHHVHDVIAVRNHRHIRLLQDVSRLLVLPQMLSGEFVLSHLNITKSMKLLCLFLRSRKNVLHLLSGIPAALLHSRHMLR